jgi:hypothetical protein
MEKLKKCFITIQIGIILFSSTLKIHGQEEKNYFEGPKFEIISKSIDKVREGDIEGALKNLEKGIEKFPNDPNLFYARGRIKSFYLKDSLGALVDNEYAKKISGVDHNRSGFFFPYLKLSNLDTLNYPIKVELELIFNDIYDFETKNSQFFAKFEYAAYSKYDTIYKTFYNRESDITDLRKIIKLDYVSSDQTKISDLKLDFFNPTVGGAQYSSSVENSFYHNWDLRNYPFDKQKILIRFLAEQDSSIVSLSESKRYPASYNKEMIGLKDGYKIDEINFFKSYRSTGTFFQQPLRMRIYPIGNFEIIISREGSWLFIKLFLGSILSFIISWIVFLIPRKEFESRISLTVGAIFGAIGNRYFVESTIPSVQILTKADMINNMILLLLIVNVLIVIIQNNEKINFGLLENNEIAMIFSGVTFIILNTLIIIW